MDRITKLLVGIGGIVIIVLTGVLVILDKDPTAYVGSLGAIITTLVVNGVIGKRIETVAKNVNGNQSKLLAENAELRKALVTAATAAPASPRDPEEVYPPLMSEDTLASIESAKNQLPSHKA